MIPQMPAQLPGQGLDGGKYKNHQVLNLMVLVYSHLQFRESRMFPHLSS